MESWWSTVFNSVRNFGGFVVFDEKMVDTSLLVQTLLIGTLIVAMHTDFFDGRFDLFGPYPRRPLKDPELRAKVSKFVDLTYFLFF